MRKSLYIFLGILLSLSLDSCQKKEFDEFYGRPDWLAEPIYQQLQERKNFNHFLALADKAGYRDVLNQAGYWTLFAPNDHAFENYFSEKNISGIDAIDSASARNIVEYALVYNAFKTDHLCDYQSNIGWVANSAFRRRTAYYDFVYTEVSGEVTRKVVASNRNGSYFPADNNNKYLPYFMDAYMNASKLSATDYNYFYPASSYTGFNVAGATVVTKDLIAENGVIHETDKVLEPLPSIDQYLSSQSTYSEFKKLLDKYKVSYSPSQEATHRYQVLTGAPDQVYAKLFDVSLAFSPNNENYLKLTDNDGQSSAWTLFAPTDQTLLAYANSVLLEHYPVKSMDQLPLSIITDFINAHMWQRPVWPTKFSTTTNFLNEEARFDPAADVVDKRVLSNGLFYGVSKVQHANVFHTVYGKAYLDPSYSLMTKALDLDLKLTVTNPNLQFVVFMVSDEVLKKNGFDWNTTNNTFQYTAPGGTVVIGTDAVNRLKRILNTHIVLANAGTAANLSGEGIVETIGGELIRYNANKVYSSGTLDNTLTANQQVNISAEKEATNGKVYYGDGLLTFSEQNIGKHIEKYGTNTNDPFFAFYQYLKNSEMYTASTGEIQGIQPGVFYTVFIPDNASIKQAALDGWLPKTATNAPNYTPTTIGDIQLVTDFIKYHIINKSSIIADGKKDGDFETLLKNSVGDPVSVKITNVPGTLQATDVLSVSPTGRVTNPNQSILSNRTVLHQLNNYLKYTK